MIVARDERRGHDARSWRARFASSRSRFLDIAGVALFFVLVASRAAAAAYNPTKCSACEAVASELRRRLDDESRTAPIDLRGRLGPSSGAGNRRGRLVEWRASEQRAVELLDGLCAAMAADYRLVVADGSEESAGVWRRYKGKGREGEARAEAPPASGPGATAHEAHQKQLATACGLLLEEVEEELVAALREDGRRDDEGGDEGEGTTSKLDVAALLCRRLARRCEGKEEAEEQQQQRAAAAATAPRKAEDEEEEEEEDDEDNGRHGGEL